ncbi:hypothetical protein FD755_009690 [Muntiacus reevesi]|uniref:Integrin alpha first immunoglubulin-like domain-containing protein n=1 Tax=Muntiacus reevesi TaxID=9886 RepID=A0A5N3XW06_MUNRE|nr:hypothetical protein FD755_009690 [Muntiacus reevesi]
MGGSAAQRGAGGLRALLLALVAAGTPAGAYNLDPQRPVRFQGPAGSFFGYAVLEHFHDNTRWPDFSVFPPGKNRGVSCGKTCREDRDDEWMGVSLARQPKADGRVLACAHRWKNIYYETDHILPHGFCYIIPSNLQAKGRTLIPCYEEYKKKYGEEHGSCQAGIAGFFTEELVVMGAPGSFYWSGTVKVLNLTDNTYFKLNDEVIMNRRYTYLGYAVTAGHFSHVSSTDVVGGAPQDEGIGKVYIFRADRRSGTLIKIFQASGKKMGSYFGSSLCAVDLNTDGLSDLLVGAPMFSEIRDEGQVTVYVNKGNGVLEEQLTLSGDGAYNAHFGESIASLGDLDDDGFPDVAIGAPKEDDFSGAVYIYHGDARGMVPQYSMKLSGRKISPVLRMFGQSISGGIDMDGNSYPDVTVGAFMSDSVVLLRARPVITVDVSIFLPASINITAPQCHDGQQPVNCLNVTACFSFHGKHVPGEIGLNYVLTADVAKKEKSQLPRVYFVLLGESVGQVSEKLRLIHLEETCHHYVAHVKVNVHLELVETFILHYVCSFKFYFRRRRTFVSSFLKWESGSSLWIFLGCRARYCQAFKGLHLMSSHFLELLGGLAACTVAQLACLWFLQLWENSWQAQGAGCVLFRLSLVIFFLSHVSRAPDSTMSLNSNWAPLFAEVSEEVTHSSCVCCSCFPFSHPKKRLGAGFSHMTDCEFAECSDPSNVNLQWKISWRKAWQPTPAFLPGESSWTEEPCRVQSIGSQRLSWSKENLCVRKRRKENHKIFFFSWKKNLRFTQMEAYCGTLLCSLLFPYKMPNSRIGKQLLGGAGGGGAGGLQFMTSQKVEPTWILMLLLVLGGEIPFQLPFVKHMNFLKYMLLLSRMCCAVISRSVVSDSWQPHEP